MAKKPQQNEADRAQSEARQRELRDAGFSTPIDGNWGPDSQKQWDAYQAAKRDETARQQKAQEAAKQAEAQSKMAEAEAAKAEAEKIRAESERARAAEDKQKRADEAAAAEAQRVFDTAVKGTAIVAGFGSAPLIAKGIEKKVAASIAAKAPSLKAAGEDIAKLTAQANSKTVAGRKALQKLAGAIKAADDLGLTKVARGPGGLILAGGLIIEGVASRAVSADLENETLQTIGVSVGTASIAAGVGTGAKELYARANPVNLPSGADLSKVEQGRSVLVANSNPSPSAKPTPPTQPVKIAQAITPPDPAKMTAGQLRQFASEQGVKNASRMNKADVIAELAKRGVTGAAADAGSVASKITKGLRFAGGVALKALGPVAAVIAAGAAFTDSAAAGESADVSTAKGVAAAGDSLALGLPTTANDALKGQGGVSGFISDTAAKGISAAQSFIANAAGAVAEKPARVEVIPPDNGANLSDAYRELISGVSGLRDFNGPAHPDLAERSPFMRIAGDFAREVASRPSFDPLASARSEPTPQPASRFSGPRGWQNPLIQEKAQQARRAKGYR